MRAGTVGIEWMYQGVTMYLLRVLALLRSYRLRLALALLCTAGAAGFALAMPQLIRWAIDFGIGRGNVAALATAALAVVGAALLRGVFAYGQQYLSEWVAQRVAYELRNQLYDRLQRLSFAFHDRAQTGQLMSRATQDVEAVRLFVNFGVLRLAYLALLLLVVLAFMAWSDWRLTLVAWAFVPLIVWRSTAMSLSLRPLWLRVQEGMGRLTTVLQEALAGFRVVKAFGREEYEGRRFAAEAQALFADSYAASRIQAVQGPLLNGLWMLAIIAVLLFGGWQTRNGALTAGELAAFLLYLTLLQMPVRALGWVVAVYTRALSAAQRIYEVLDAEPEVKERPGAIVLRDVKGHVRFEGVSFSYDSRSPALWEIDLEARPGEVVALLGPAGSGKTTIVNLIPRFYDVTAGRITIDGVDVRDVTLASLRRAVGVVPQDVFLFSATLRDNIAYGAPWATQEEIERVAKIARIHDFIVSLPEGYDTWVGERGVTLSGGQKQRIAIARTLLRDPRVLILDDSTSSVDAETEYLIQQALAEAMKGRTTFVIAHRLRTVQAADQVLVLKDGRIVERGRHEELLRLGGLYRQIYEQELREQEEGMGLPGPTRAGHM
ncbi:Putative multidrug export ATP-binding/permease protein [bacterium HR25]|nr:Putative multidrug export ATP-binding/permease protein [bacterium HR25]